MSDPLATFRQQLKIRHCIFACLQQVSLGLPARCRAESSFFGARQKSQRQQKLKTRNGSTLNASFRSRAAALPFSKVLLHQHPAVERRAHGQAHAAQKVCFWPGWNPAKPSAGTLSYRKKWAFLSSPFLQQQTKKLVFHHAARTDSHHCQRGSQIETPRFWKPPWVNVYGVVLTRLVACCQLRATVNRRQICPMLKKSSTFNGCQVFKSENWYSI